MKVFQLLESEWENASLDPTTHLRDLRRKRQALIHRREVIFGRLKQLFPDYDEDTIDRMFSAWLIKGQQIEQFPERSRNLVASLKRIDIEGEKLQKEEVAAKINMKYARHDPEFALRHARLRQGQYIEGEDAIARSPAAAYDYATTIIHHRFPKGEAAIATEPELKIRYEQMFGVKI